MSASVEGQSVVERRPHQTASEPEAASWWIDRAPWATCAPHPGTVAARERESAIVTAARVMALQSVEGGDFVGELRRLSVDDPEALEAAVTYWERRLRHRRSDDFAGQRALRLLRSALIEARNIGVIRRDRSGG